MPAILIVRNPQRGQTSPSRTGCVTFFKEQFLQLTLVIVFAGRGLLTLVWRGLTVWPRTGIGKLAG